MADAPGTEATGKGLGFLTRKVGPLPLGVWGLAFLGIWWYLSKHSKGGTTDPAGNVGTIDPATGYVYGSPQDKQALSGSGAGATSPAPDTSGSTTSGAYQDNNAWGRAAINYLVSLGVDPTSANEAIQQYLSSQTLTAAQQANVNLAIQALGPPPSLPGPGGNPVTPIVTPPTGTVYAANPPTGLTVSGKTDTTVTLKWNAVTNATGYIIHYGKTADATDGNTSTDSTVTSVTVGSLTANTLYYFRVQGLPARDADPFASVQATTSAASSPPPPAPSPPSGGGGGGTRTHKVVSGETLWSIAAHYYGAGSQWPRIYNANKSALDAAARAHGHTTGEPGYGPGSKWIFPGEVVTIP